ncbi:hypothetical protein PG997_003021 [Apiospora hydei]|uniref:DRBM domain-containing protein n=1 Tax=Apiospora hydei TaxID=1337664 RepID=A0ABR1WY24_9PEZI
MSLSFGANVYSDILQWVNMQQQLEISGQPANMTAAQHKAVKDLHQLIKPRPKVMEPEMGKQDWIGLLNPRGVDPATGLVPSFTKKQTAKHYAARCAVEWLVQQGLMPQRLAAEVPGAAALRGAGAGASSPATTMTRPLPVSSSPSSPEAKRQKMTASEPVEASSSSAVKQEQGDVESAATATVLNEDSNNDAAGGSFTGTVYSRPSLMNTTAVAKMPQNQQPQPPLINLFTSSSADSSASNSSGGTPIVPPSEPRTSPPATIASINAAAQEENGRPLPHGTGHVENVFGKSNAREEIARRVLLELRKIKQQRDDIKKELMRDLGPTVG